MHHAHDEHPHGDLRSTWGSRAVLVVAALLAIAVALDDLLRIF